MASRKAPLRLQRFDELEFVPRFEYGAVHEFKARDCIWLPTGTELIYEAESALIHFAIHPSNWHQVE